MYKVTHNEPRKGQTSMYSCLECTPSNNSLSQESQAGPGCSHLYEGGYLKQASATGIGRDINGTSATIFGQHRFTNPAMLIENIIRLDCKVHWETGVEPKNVHELVRLEDLTRITHIPPPPVPAAIEEYVDNQLSCSIAYECT